LAIGDHSAFRFQVRVDDAAAGGLISNAADLDYQVATTGVTGHYTTNLAQTPVAAQADLEVTKSISPDHAVYGQPVTTTITVRNPVGPSTAQTVSVGDFLPPGFTITGPISITDPSGRAPGTCFQPAGAMSCQLTDLPVGATVIISYTGASSSDPGLSRPTLVNMATVASTTFDPNQDNNLALATVEQRSGADLQVTKTPTGFTARPGTTDAYTITVRNAGPSDANQVELIDLVPAASAEVLTVRSVNYQGDASADGVDCAPDRSLRWVCRIASLKASEQAIFQVVAQISADARPGDQFINQAQVTSATPEFDNSNNQAEAVGTVAQRQADIALTKSVDASPVVAGGGIVYTITAQNLGPSIATQVDLTDLLPAGVTVSAVSSSRGSCSTTGNRLDCSLASADDPMLVGTSATITISGQVHAAASSVANTVSYTASPDQPDPQPDNNQASVDPPVQAVADLAVTKTSTTRTLPAALGERIDFTISVVNHGPSLARQVELVDQLPLGLTLDQARFALPAGVNCSPLTPDQQLLCRLPDLAPGQQLELTVPTTASAEGLVGQVFELLQRVTVAGAVTDPDLSNNQASWRIDAQPQADLSVSKELLSGSPLTAGGLAHYRLTVANAGDNASRPQLTDQLPSGLAFQSVTSSHQSASECTPSGQVLTCLSDIPLQVGDQWAIDLMVKVDPGLTDQTQLTNHASVVDSLGVADPSLSNNQASLTSPVRSLTDLAVAAIDWRAFQGQDAPPGVSLTASPAGSTIWLTMDFLNQGPAAAMSAAMRVNSDLHLAVLTDDSGAPIVRWNGAVSAAGSNSCRLVEGELVCPLVNGSTDSAWSGSDVLGPGDRSSVAVLVYVYPDTAGSSGRGWVDATTSTPESDDLANNHRQAPLAISDGKSNLSVDKQIISESLIDGSLIAGRYFAYAIDVFQPAPADPTSGQGFADAADVVFTDPLPTGFHASSVYTTQGSCEQPAPGADQSIRCDLGTVPGPLPTVDGQRVTITVFGEIDEAAAPGVVTNVATATSSTGPQTVSGQRSTPLAAQADLELAMTVISPHRVGADGLPEVVAGQSLRYGLTVSNTGPSLAPGAVISVVLPAGLTLGVGSSRACGQSSPVGQSPVTVSCLLDRPLAVGASLTRSIVAVTPAAGDDQILTSHAQVALPGDASITDPVSENNQALASVRIARTVDLAVTATVSDLTPTPGDALTWVFTGHNLGPSIAGPSVMTVTLPDSFVADWTASRLDGSCSISSSGQGVDNRLTCRPLARLAPGDTLHQVIIGSFAIGTPPGDHTATGSISSASPESATDNNQASLTVNPVPKADLRLHKDLLTPAPIAAGVLVNYRLVAVSFGPSLADNVVVSDQLPIGMTIVTARFQAASNAGDCAAWPGDGGQSILRCEVGDLALMESVQVDLSVQLAASAEGQEFCNAALVGSGVIDPDAANNAARADCFRASGVIDPGPPTSPGQPAPAPGVTPSPTPPVPPTPGASRPAAPTGGLASAAGPGRVAVLAVLVAGGLLLGSALIRRRGRARDGWHQSGLH
jgi:uncharacterized repeat protein (TIGR01451 family)